MSAVALAKAELPDTLSRGTRSQRRLDCHLSPEVLRPSDFPARALALRLAGALPFGAHLPRTVRMIDCTAGLSGAAGASLRKFSK
jgi:hypothetical protein